LGTITAVFFDLDGTLRQNLPSGGEVFADHALELGLQIEPEDRRRAARWEQFYWAMSQDLLDDRQRFDGRTGEFWNNYGQRQLLALGASTLQAAELAPTMTQYMLKSYNPESIVPEDVLRVLPALKENGYRLAAISNRDRAYQDEIDTLGLGPYLEFCLAGGELRAFKPEPEIFLYACRKVGVTPRQAAYVGDSYFADVVGAWRAKMTPVLYDPGDLFPNAGCATIKTFDELPGLLA
jgi:HAD superfamily hydrolase (TIGR01549 family)